MSFNTIEFVINEGVATLTLNRPKSLNSLTSEMHVEIRKVMTQVENDAAIRCLVITGAGRGFCAGQDLGDGMEGGDVPNVGKLVDEYYNPFIARIMNLPKPVICAVNGVAAGAGASIALACDIVFAASSASFMQAFCKIGLAPDTAGEADYNGDGLLDIYLTNEGPNNLLTNGSLTTAPLSTRIAGGIAITSPWM